MWSYIPEARVDVPSADDAKKKKKNKQQKIVIEMKFFSGRQLLRHATSLPLVEINFEDVHASLDFSESVNLFIILLGKLTSQPSRFFFSETKIIMH